MQVYTLLADSANPLTLYASVPNAMFKTTNGGISWLPITGVNGTAFALAADPTNPSTIYAGFGTNGAYVSFDHGTTWAPINTGLSGSALFVRALAVDPKNPNIVYRGTFGGSVWVSSDSGLSWKQLDGAGRNVDSLVIAGGTIYAGSLGRGVFKRSVQTR